MEVIIILLPLALLLGSTFIAAFIWSARHGQYDDLETPKFRMLLEDRQLKKRTSNIRKDEK